MANQMTENERQFLIAEFTTAWEQIFKIDDRRGVFLRYYTIIFLGVISFFAGLISSSNKIGLEISVILSFVLLFTLYAGVVIRGVLESERAANVRYRRKINLIREIFLKNSGYEDVQFYIQQKDIGVLLFSEDTQPAGVGRTLQGIYTLIYVEQISLIFALIVLWGLYFQSLS